MNKIVGIIGAGKVGSAIGRLAADSGWQVLFYDVAPIENVNAAVLATDSNTRFAELPELIDTADIVVLAIPFGIASGADLSALSGKVVLDPTNHWPGVDGPMPELDAWPGSTSGLLASHSPQVRLVKSLNHLSYHDFTSDARSAGASPRRAIAVASDDAAAREVACQFVNDIGFDPVPVPFDRAKLLEPEGPVFGHWLNASEMRAALSVV